MKKTAVTGLGVCAMALAFAAKDPVIMTVNGVDVPQSEFEYLYNKNSQQQINPQTLDEYVEMFKLYKMKVADARAEGIDTLRSFRKEADQYRYDLAAPYLADSVYLNQLVAEAYDRSKEEVEAYHIMLFKSRDASQNPAIRQKADSLLQVLRNGGDFATLAAQYSQDRGSSQKGGRMGWIITNTYPIAFELEAFRLPEGQISDVVESPVGYHILKGGKHRKARGKVHVAHILKLTRDKDEAGKAKARHDIDSIYNLVMKNPNTFSLVAQMGSDDKASARQGGQLPWFGAGEMVEQFDSAAFALADGEISKPVETAYGYHVIQRLESKDIPSLEELKPQVLSKISNPQDDRFKLVRARQTAKLAKMHKGRLSDKSLAAMRTDIATGGIDSVFFAKWNSAPYAEMAIASVDGKSHPVKEFISTMSRVKMSAPAAAAEIFDEMLDDYYNSILVKAEMNRLEKEEPDYRNLLKEYIDGSLLYEVSVRKVWDKAARDTEGLQKFFEANRSNYHWTEPHAKGFIVQAVNDSVAELVRNRAAQLGKDSLVNTIRKEFPGTVGIEKVLVSKGQSPMIDYLVFGGKEVKPSNSKFTVSFMIDPRVITEPEEVSDVKGLVTSDYQNEFQEAWEECLRKKYPVTVNQKVLSKVKPVK